MPLRPRQQEVLAELGITRWVPRAPVPAPAPAAAPVEQADGETDWAVLEAEVVRCTACAQLAATRSRTVFGTGDRAARWLFIGEAPGAEEDRRGEPFVGRAGQLLDSMLEALGLQRGQDVYIANVLKCRPPGNRDPSPDEAAACRGFLDRQIALVAPRVIVALGRIAAQNLLGTDAPLGRLRDQRLEYQGIPLVATYHPAYLLRSPAEKAKAWRDLLAARALVDAGP
jgi:uracil-DNA glycosylase